MTKEKNPYHRELVCRGSVLYGTGCGNCAKCSDEFEGMRQKIQEAEYGGTLTSAGGV